MANKANDNYTQQKTEILLHESFPPSQFTDKTGISLRRHVSDHMGDELILSLSDSRENRRARQVFEWETVRRNTIREI